MGLHYFLVLVIAMGLCVTAYPSHDLELESIISRLQGAMLSEVRQLIDMLASYCVALLFVNVVVSGEGIECSAIAKHSL